MENNPSSVETMGDKQNLSETPILSQEEMLLEILENSRKTKNYMKWQLYITVALVVLPLLAALAIIPMALSSISNIYGVGGVLQ